MGEDKTETLQICKCGHSSLQHYHNLVAGTACRVKGCQCDHYRYVTNAYYTFSEPIGDIPMTDKQNTNPYGYTGALKDCPYSPDYLDQLWSEVLRLRVQSENDFTSKSLSERHQQAVEIIAQAYVNPPVDPVKLGSWLGANLHRKRKDQPNGKIITESAESDPQFITESAVEDQWKMEILTAVLSDPKLSGLRVGATYKVTFATPEYASTFIGLMQEVADRLKWKSVKGKHRYTINHPTDTRVEVTRNS